MVLPLFDEMAIWESPIEYLDSTLEKTDVKCLLFHLKSKLVIEDRV